MSSAFVGLSLPFLVKKASRNASKRHLFVKPRRQSFLFKVTIHLLC